MFGRCRLDDKTAKHRNFGKIRVWPKPNCYNSQAFVGQSTQSCHPEPRSNPAEAGNLETITAMANQRLMQWTAQATPPPAMATTSVNFTFGDGDIFDKSHSSSHNRHLLHHVQNQSLMKISTFHPNGIFTAPAGIDMTQKPVQVKQRFGNDMYHRLLVLDAANQP